MTYRTSRYLTFSAERQTRCQAGDEASSVKTPTPEGPQRSCGRVVRTHMTPTRTEPDDQVDRSRRSPLERKKDPREVDLPHELGLFARHMLEPV